MAIDFSKYVYQQRPLQDWSFGKALQDLGDARRDDQRLDIQRGQLAEQSAVRRDTNTRWAGDLSQTRATATHGKDNDRYNKQNELVKAGYEAAARMDFGAAEAIAQSLRQMGGSAVIDYDENKKVTGYTFSPGGRPGMAPLDTQGVMQNAFGGGSPQQPPPQPRPDLPGSFDMRSNVGPGSPPPGARNPFERLQGSSAAAMPAPPAPSAPAAPPQPPAPPPTAGIAPQPPPPGTAQPGAPNTTPPDDIQKLSADVARYEQTAPKTGAESDLEALEALNAEPELEDDEGPAVPPGQQRTPVENPAYPEEMEGERTDEEVLATPETEEEANDPSVRDLDRNVRLYDAQRAAAGLPPPGPLAPPYTQGPAPAADAPPPEAPAAAAPPPEAPPQAPAPQPQGALTGPNPMQPPTFSPYRMDIQRLQAMNREQTAPYFRGQEQSSPYDLAPRVKLLNEGISAMGLPLDRAAELNTPGMNRLSTMYNSDRAAQIAGVRMDAQRSNAEWRHAQVAEDRNQQKRNRAIADAERFAKEYGLSKLKEDMGLAHKIYGAIRLARTNGAAANALVGYMHDLSTSGIMTDKDYSHAKDGVVSVAEYVRKNFIELFLKREGINDDSLNKIKDFVDETFKAHRSRLLDTRDHLYSVYKSATDEGTKEGYAEAIKLHYNEPDWPEEFRVGSLPTASSEYEGEDERQPATRGAQVSPNGTPLVRSPRVPAKPPRRPPPEQPAKPVRNMTLDEIRRRRAQLNGQ